MTIRHLSLWIVPAALLVAFAVPAVAGGLTCEAGPLGESLTTLECTFYCAEGATIMLWADGVFPGGGQVSCPGGASSCQIAIGATRCETSFENGSDGWGTCYITPPAFWAGCASNG